MREIRGGYSGLVSSPDSGVVTPDVTPLCIERSVTVGKRKGSFQMSFDVLKAALPLPTCVGCFSLPFTSEPILHLPTGRLLLIKAATFVLSDLLWVAHKGLLQYVMSSPNSASDAVKSRSLTFATLVRRRGGNNHL